jgi:hypothetical protein
MSGEYTREQLEMMDELELDEIVIELKCREASEINNGGPDGQIRYILGQPGGGVAGREDARQTAAPEPSTPCWSIEVREVWVQTVRVHLSEASTLGQAVSIVAEAGGERVEDGLEYSHTMGREHWTAYGPDGRYYDQLDVSPIPGT